MYVKPHQLALDANALLTTHVSFSPPAPPLSSALPRRIRPIRRPYKVRYGTALYTRPACCCTPKQTSTVPTKGKGTCYTVLYFPNSF